jgi:hypothetical protein
MDLTREELILVNKRYKQIIDNLRNDSVSVHEYNKLFHEHQKSLDQINTLMMREQDATQTIEKLDNIIYNLRQSK